LVEFYKVRENKNNVCPTLTSNMGTGGHNVPLIKDSKGIRKLTPRECFNLQGFPSDYKLPTMSDAGLYKLAGNAVSYPVVKKIADKIVKILDDIPVKKDTKEIVIDDLPKEIKKKKKVKDVVV
jgi:DNA (cytosine-5)-methyltransferase 1